MTSTFEFVTTLARQDIKLWLDGERLRINAPEGALSPPLVAQLKERKAEIMTFLRQYEGGSNVTTMQRLARPNPLPLSFAQQRLWFLAQLEGSQGEPGGAYNIPAALQLCGPLDSAAFNASWQQLEARHEALRTTFPQTDGRAYQQINPPSFQLNFIDLADLPKAEQVDEVTRLARQAAVQAFDLVNGPLWRVTLLRLGYEEHVLFVTMHHIIADGWSIGVLTREFSTIYTQLVATHQPHPSPPQTGEGAVTGQTTVPPLNRGRLGGGLPALTIQYADFAVWQRTWLTGDVLEKHLGYWKAQLADAPPILTLPTDRPRPAVQSYRGARFSVTLPKTLTSALKSLSQQHNATLFMTFQAAFAVLLARYAGQDDICIGTPIANRQNAEIENLVGFFVNTLVLRTDLADNPPFRALLARVRQVALDAYQHQALPFELVVEALRPERSLAHSPLFQVMFVLQNNRQETPAFADLQVSPMELTSTVAKFDLTLTMQEVEETLIATWQYSTDLFDSTTIARMAGHFQTLLAGIVADVDQPVARLPLLTVAERQQLLVEWNDTAVAYPADRCLHQLFEAQVERTQDAFAVVFAEQRLETGDRRSETRQSPVSSLQSLTHRELNKRANQLAHTLIAKGVGPGMVVGLCAERSVEMMVGLLAILKAGGAYLPLDPTYPLERLAFMVEDAQVELILIQAELRTQLTPLQAYPLLVLDEPGAPLPDECWANPTVAVKPTDLAYIIYTSGSTGKPKGVEVLHQGVVNYLHWCIGAYPMRAGRGVPVVASFSFDGALPTIFGPLLVGQPVILLPTDNPIDALNDELHSSSAPFGLIKGTPTHLTVLNQLAAQYTGKAQTTAIVLGGEPLPGAAVAAWWAHSPECQVFNQYGPTEATVACCYYAVGNQHEQQGDLPATLPIGRPFANNQIYLLDRYLQPVPIGVAGELYIGGVQVARGYRNRPDLTAERFISNPFGPGRLYKTGDLCRAVAAPDGSLLHIEFLGRTDDQVKIRGFRIELGEIEAIIRQHAGVQDVVVVVDEEKGSKRLIAYIVGEVNDLRAQLSRSLPDYMIPAVFVRLATLPLTANGKVNRRVLPKPTVQHTERQRALPQTPQEATLAAIWQAVLGLDQIGVTENFFQVGGDSILSIQIVSRAREAGLHLTPKDLFQHQTIAELARVAKVVTTTQAKQGVVTGGLPLTPIQQRFFAQNWDEPHHFNQAVLLELNANVNPSWLETAVRQLLIQHDGLRLRFVHQGDGWQQRIVAPTAAVPFDVIDLSSLPLPEQEVMLKMQANRLQTSLDLAHGPLLRVALFQMTAANRLLMIIHHLAVDGVSWRILLEDLQRAYQQLAQGEPLQLPAKTTSFKAWATLLQEKGPAAVAAERAYWAQIRAGDTPALPVDHQLGINTNASAAAIVTHLERAHTEFLLNTAPALYHTQINDLLLTALAIAFHAWTGQATLLLDLEGHGREELFSDDALAVDLSRTVGWFTTIFPVRLTLEDTVPGAAIKAIKEQLRQIPQRGIGYGILRYLQPIPLGQAAEIDPPVSFNYLGQFDQSVRGPLINGFATAAGAVTRSPAGRRAHLLEITGVVVGSELQVKWVYSQHYHQAATIQRLADCFTAALQTLLTHCQEPTAGGYTPSDFPDTALSQTALDTLLAAIAQVNSGTQERMNWINQQIEAIYPLSPSQQGMLLETLARPAAGLHIEQSVFDWQGPLNNAMFDYAWQRVSERHSTLRTGFAWEGLDEALQFVLRRAPMPITHHWLTALSAAEQQAHIDNYVAEDRRRGFDLLRAPLMRLAIFALADNLHRIVWTRHHILTDGWSLSLLTREVMAFYQAAGGGETLHLRPSPPYKTYISWLRRQSFAASEAFWREELAGFTAPTPLATKAGPDHATGAAPDETQGYATATATLPAGATAALTALSRQYGLTINTLVQASWAVLLHHYGAAIDVLFGATVAGRPPEIVDVEAMVGLFINSVPVRIKLTPVANGSLLAWLQNIQTQNLAQQPHAYCSAGQIHQWSAVPAALPLYESLLVFENYPVAAAAAEHVAPPPERIEFRDAGSVGAQTSYALTLLVLPGTELRFQAVYNTTRFAAADLQQLLAHLLRLLEAMPTAPQQPLADFIRSDAQLPPVYPPQKQTAVAAFVAPRSATERQLAHIWQAALGIPAIGVDDSFFALGGHSLVAVWLMAQIQQHFAVNLSLATLFQCPTIALLAKRLTALSAGEQADWSTLVPIQPHGTQLPFFCAPGAGGNVLYLNELAQSMGMDQPFYGLQSVGLDGETAPHTTIEAMAAQHIKDMQRVQPQGPYRLGGHSFGAKVVFEMARQLVQAGERVARLIILDATAPTPRPASRRETWDTAQWAFGLASVVSELLGAKTLLTYAELQPLAPEAQLLRLKAEFEQLNFLPPGGALSPVRGLLQVLKSNMSVKYTPKSVLPAPITLFRATEGLPSAPEEPEEARLRQDPTFGWGQFTQYPVAVRVVPGGHATMIAQPHVAVLATRLRDCLQDANEVLAHVASEVQGIIMARNKAGVISLRLWPT